MINNRIRFAVLIFLVACAASGGVGWLTVYLDRGPAKAPASPPTVAEITSRDIDALRNEIRVLRADLGNLREAVDQSRRQDRVEKKSTDPESITYQGKPASSWLAVLNDRDPMTRVKAVAPLAAISAKQPSLVPVVLKCLEDEDEAVRVAAVGATNALQAPARDTVPALVATDVWCREVLPVLREIDPRGEVAVPTALKALHHPKTRVRRNAGSIVYAFDKSKASLALSAYIEALRDWTDYGGRDYLPDPFQANKYYCSQAELAIKICHDLGPQAKDAIPSLLEAFKLIDEEGRLSASNPRAHLLPFIRETIGKLDPQGTHVVP